jgi:hypothetical protein
MFLHRQPNQVGDGGDGLGGGEVADAAMQVHPQLAGQGLVGEGLAVLQAALLEQGKVPCQGPLALAGLNPEFVIVRRWWSWWMLWRGNGS